MSENRIPKHASVNGGAGQDDYQVSVWPFWLMRAQNGRIVAKVWAFPSQTMRVLLAKIFFFKSTLKDADIHFFISFVTLLGLTLLELDQRNQCEWPEMPKHCPWLRYPRRVVEVVQYVKGLPGLIKGLSFGWLHICNNPLNGWNNYDIIPFFFFFTKSPCIYQGSMICESHPAKSCGI